MAVGHNVLIVAEAKWPPEKRTENENATLLKKEMNLKTSSVKWRPQCVGLNVLTHCGQDEVASVW